MAADLQQQGIHLRPARVEDATSLAALSIEVWLGTYLRRGVNAFFADYVFAELTPSRFETLLQTQSETFILSQNTDGLDGFIRLSQGKPPPTGLTPTGLTLPDTGPGSEVEIATLYVQPRHQGRGLGQALLKAGLQFSRDLGAPYPWLTTNAENTPAIGFYQRMGFQITGRTQFSIQDQSYPNEVLTYRPSQIASQSS